MPARKKVSEMTEVEKLEYYEKKANRADDKLKKLASGAFRNGESAEAKSAGAKLISTYKLPAPKPKGKNKDKK